MSLVDNIGGKTFRRTPTSIDKTTVFTDGFLNQFGPTSSDPAGQDIPTIIANSGSITLSRTYITGRRNLTVIVDGITLINEGPILAANDYVEVDNTTIRLGTDVLNGLNPSTSYIRIIWNKPLPGVRDQNLSNLKNISEDLEDAVLDPLNLRVADASALNPFATLADGGGGGGSGAPLVGKTFVPVIESEKSIGLVATTSGSGNFSGSLNLATAGAARGIPVGATHALIRAQVDMNVGSGQKEYIVHVVESGAGPSAGTGAAWTNAAFTGSGEGSGADSGYIVVPLASSAPHIDWHLIDTGLAGSAALLRLRLDIDGWLIDETGSAPSPVSFSSRHSGNQFTSVSAPGGPPASVLVGYDTPEFNVGSGFNPTAGVFTAPIAGKYVFTGSIGWSGAVAPPQQLVLYLIKNGATTLTRQIMVTTSAENDPTITATVLADLDLGDTVDVRFEATHSGTFPSVIGATATYFQGSLLGTSGGGVPLEGRTFVPVDGPNADFVSEAVAGVSSGDWFVNGKFNVAPPANATHARIRLVGNSDAVGSGDMQYYLGAYVSGGVGGSSGNDNGVYQASLASPEFRIAHTSQTSSANSGDWSATSNVELNDPRDPSFDVTLFVNDDIVTVTNRQVWMILEGWYVEEIASVGGGSFGPALEKFHTAAGGPSAIGAAPSILDSDSGANTMTLTAPQDGTYLVSFSGSFLNLGSPGSLEIYLEHNASQQAKSIRTTSVAAGEYGTLHTEAKITMLAGDTVDVLGVGTSTTFSAYQGTLNIHQVA